ncbi:hypothetical protein SAMN04487947_1235 [Halogeometricum rufum]|uniref:Terminase-like family protein n=1 Tax=Halogeometricum rufum TaxID=553469 RepID=A0A1I6GJ84_9EURY|nr:hypothetical protein [Halogeometricum rufum]SFR42191.1 hypothetical protein SAMN04487947_1235 [Halogeometricum rufum]
MSTTETSLRDVSRRFSERARRGDPTWLEDAIEAYLDVTVTEAQRKICRAIVENEKLLVQTANGIGKSFILACVTNVWLVTLSPGSVLATSGTYPKLKRTFCKPVESLHDNALGGIGLPGEYKRSPPRIEIDGRPNQYFEAASPKDTGELEGVHGGYVLGIIEEADKDDVTEATFDSMESLVSDQRDRLVAIANPPEDESNSLQQLYEDPTWETIRLTSFDSHNVHVERGTVDGEKIDGLATVWKIKQDWESYVGEEWPGFEQAKTAHVHRDDLDARWYRRRIGVTPPASASVYRPLDPSLVETAYDPDATPTRETPSELGIDVARSGDETVAFGVHNRFLKNEYAARGTDHVTQEQRLAAKIREWPTPGLAVDAVGEGSGLADGLDDRFGTVTRFKNQSEAVDGTAYDDKWAESLGLFATWLEQGGTFADSDLYEQAKVAARTIQWEEKHLGSRGDGGADVLAATPKAEVKERLGRSPDHLDAALMAVWLSETETSRDYSDYFDW